MNKKVITLFHFLVENRRYNLSFQKKTFEEWLLYYGREERAYSLLMNVYQTQSKPKLNSAAQFFKPLFNSKRSLSSFKSFCDYLNVQNEYNYSNLFTALRNKKGWGNKTVALFTKILFQIRGHKELQHLLFWKDTPLVSGNDKIYLPVDRVILEIFTYIDKSKTSFSAINKYLQEYFKNSDLEIWDDLWFWGFFTQTGSAGRRKLGFNEGKYWANLHTDKSQKMIKEINSKSKKFISILRS